MKTTTIVSQKGQVEIPDSIRKLAPWVESSSAVSISLERPDEIVIRPKEREVDWDKIWAGIKRARAIKGRGTTSAAEFLEKDRRSH